MAKVILNNGAYVLRDEWTIEDIQSVGEDMEIIFPEGMALEIMHLLAKHYDTESGLNYQSVVNAIEFAKGL